MTHPAVYVITNKVTGKQYVGWTRLSGDKRWKSHIYKALRENVDSSIARAIRKHGPESFNFVRVYEAASEKEALIVERGLIAERGTQNPALGYNRTSGGDGAFGYRQSAETKAWRSAWMAARMADPEKRAQVGNANRGREHTAEARANMSRAHLGQQPTNLEQLRLINTGKKLTPEHKAKLRAANVGRIASVETRQKIGDAGRGRVVSAVTREKLSAVHNGRIVPVEVRAKISAARMGIVFTPETREKMRQRRLGTTLSPEVKEKIKQAAIKACNERRIGADLQCLMEAA